MQRRQLVQGLFAGGTLAALGSGCASMGGTPSSAKVVVVGGGYGGATAARYVRLFSDRSLDVVLVEPNRSFVSCPISNLVVGGARQLGDITVPYDGLRTQGVTVVHDTVASFDLAGKKVRLAGGPEIRYDKLVLSPGVDMMFDGVEGLRQAQADGMVLQAWKAGPETVALHRQLVAMPDGGVYAITIPEAPYRCPPGPYERASVVAAYLKAHKPKSKVLILDANPDVTSKGPLFKKAWTELYGSMVEYRGQHRATAVDAKAKTIKFDVQDDVKADVLNVLPPMRAGLLAVQSGLATANARWCQVNYQTFESTVAKDVYVLGDAIQVAPLMPKSGHMANQHGKVAAAAVLAALAGQPPNPEPVLNNTCYSYITDRDAVHVASVHQYDAKQQTYLTVPGSGGLSAAKNAREGDYGLAWAQSIWADMLG